MDSFGKLRELKHRVLLIRLGLLKERCKRLGIELTKGSQKGRMNVGKSRLDDEEQPRDEQGRFAEKGGGETPSSVGPIPKERLKHISTGTFSDGELKSGGHSQKAFRALQSQGKLSDVEEIGNGVRIANIGGHENTAKAKKQGQSFFPEAWSDNEIAKAVKNNWREHAANIPQSGYHRFESVHKGVKLTVGFLDGKPENAFPNNPQ